MNKRFILASSSARRQDLLHLLGVSFEVITPDVDETMDVSLGWENAVKQLALRKAETVFNSHQDALVLACDTIVVCDEHSLGKPEDKEEARFMLQMLSGKTHEVITGCALMDALKTETYIGKARVSFAPMNPQEIDAYINTDEPYDKAGGYAIQGLAAKHIQAIQGDYYAVMGLPLHETYRRIKHR